MNEMKKINNTQIEHLDGPSGSSECIFQMYKRTVPTLLPNASSNKFTDRMTIISIKAYMVPGNIKTSLTRIFGPN